MTKALLLISDLVSRQQTKERLSLETIYIKTIDALEEELSKGEEVEIYFDLTNNRLDLKQALDIIRNHNLVNKTTCFFPHVRAELAETAKEAGFENVVTRGQFFR